MGHILARLEGLIGVRAAARQPPTGAAQTASEGRTGPHLQSEADPAPRSLTLWNRLSADPKHGPVVAALIMLTLVSGVVDGVSYLGLDHVFVANMTGNVVFVGFALAGAPGFSLSASLFALGGFLAGAMCAGELMRRFGPNRGVLFRGMVALETGLIGVALVISAVVARPFHVPAMDAIAALTASAMGMQNALVRRLAVPDLTTTVLTLTLTGIATDVRAHNWAVATRRLLSVVTLFLGAVGGALLVLHAHPAAALGVATGIMALVTVMAAVAVRRPADWQS
jgi:uncharacterized membrane protein YoaK (UPF0700 family)